MASGVDMLLSSLCKLVGISTDDLKNAIAKGIETKNQMEKKIEEFDARFSTLERQAIEIQDAQRRILEILQPPAAADSVH